MPSKIRLSCRSQLRDHALRLIELLDSDAPDELIVGEAERMGRLGRWLHPELAGQLQAVKDAVDARRSCGLCIIDGCERDAEPGAEICGVCETAGE